MAVATRQRLHEAEVRAPLEAQRLPFARLHRRAWPLAEAAVPDRASHVLGALLQEDAGETGGEHEAHDEQWEAKDPEHDPQPAPEVH